LYNARWGEKKPLAKGKSKTIEQSRILQIEMKGNNRGKRSSQQDQILGFKGWKRKKKEEEGDKRGT